VLAAWPAAASGPGQEFRALVTQANAIPVGAGPSPTSSR
jgi:hypothetical protein